VKGGAFQWVQVAPGDRQHWQGPGYTVEEVGPHTPAALAGVRPGDRVMAIDGRAVNGPDDLDREVQRSGNLVVVDIDVRVAVCG